jgi:arylformamidase
MIIYDISRELFSAPVYPGDKKPIATLSSSMEKGDLYNLTELSMCAHNGTHLDAPRHFVSDGISVAEVSLSKSVGSCYVVSSDQAVGADQARKILKKATECGLDFAKKILLKGSADLLLPGAEVFAEAGVDLVGCESISVGPENAPMAVHIALLSHNVVLLENLDLSQVNEGGYFLSAAPLKIAGLDGAPCRAILIDLEG